MNKIELIKGLLHMNREDYELIPGYIETSNFLMFLWLSETISLRLVDRIMLEIERGKCKHIYPGFL